MIGLINLNASADCIMKDEKLMTVEEMIKLELLKIGYCISTDTLPTNLSTNLKNDHLSQSLTKAHNYNTRNKQDLNLPKAKVKTYRDSSLFKSISEYNNLPQKLKKNH